MFAKLDQVQPGEVIVITLSDGSQVRFSVTTSEVVSQDAFPTERVYGQTKGPELRLITCDGLFDKSDQRYTNNRIVYAKVIP